MDRLPALLAASLLPFLLANCTVSSPQGRIDRNYSLYESLSPDHQELVQQGRIAKGMSKSAVYLALGNPNGKMEGFRDNVPFERWDYTRLHPVIYNSFHGYPGHLHSHRWAHDHYGYCHGVTFSPEVEYVPYRSASVVFTGGVVDSWERVSPPYH